MLRLNFVLLAILIACAVGIVTAQHRARRLFVELQQLESAAKQMDIEFGQLELEQSTWAMHARIEKIALSRLHMRLPSAERTQLVGLYSSPAAPQQ